MSLYTDHEISQHVPTVVDRFDEWIRENPKFYWDVFKPAALRLIAKQVTRFSAAHVFEETRHDPNFGSKGDEWKLNNNHRAYCARMFRLESPALAHKIAIRGDGPPDELVMEWLCL